ncbi:MAG: FGGY-family carbohydrate kinase [Acidobacteriota bacterium]
MRRRKFARRAAATKSAVWRQILADVFNAEVVCVQNEEGAAVGAAVQAVWPITNNRASPLLSKRFVSVT